MSREIYGAGSRRSESASNGLSRHLPPPTLYDAWRLRRLDPYCVRLADLQEGRAGLARGTSYARQQRRWFEVQSDVLAEVNRQIGSEDAFRILGRYWYDPRVRRVGRRIQAVDMEDKREAWLEMCREAQLEKLYPTLARRMGGTRPSHEALRATIGTRASEQPAPSR